MTDRKASTFKKLPTHNPSTAPTPASASTVVVAVPYGPLGAGEGVNPAQLIGNNARLQGLSVGSREMFEAMCRAIDLHRISPVVDKVFPFTEVRAAFEAMRAGEHFGKIVLTF